jgi:hypothetical protein
MCQSDTIFMLLINSDALILHFFKKKLRWNIKDF